MTKLMLINESPPQPSASMEEKLAEIWCQSLGLDHVRPEDDFFHLGGDSLTAAEVLAAIQKEFAKEFPLTLLLQGSTLREMAQLFCKESAASSWSSLVKMQAEGDRPPFFCVHGVGGTVLCFSDLARHLGPRQPFYGIRAAHADHYQPPFRRIEDMAAHYLEAVRGVQSRGPYYLGGFSFGGSVALEMAQQLYAQGESVALLAILDHTPPPLRYQRFVWSPFLVFDLLANSVRWGIEDIWYGGKGNRLDTLREKARAAKRQFRNAWRPKGSGSGKQDVEEIFDSERLTEPFRQLIETHYQALRDYVPKVYPGPVALFRAQTRPLFRLHGHDLGWKKLAGGGLKVFSIPGNHQTILREPRVGILARALAAQLQNAQVQ